LARAAAITSSTADGSSGRRCVTRGGSDSSCAHMIAMESSRLKGGAPVSISTTVQASAY
jgi:hypothetical protein